MANSRYLTLFLAGLVSFILIEPITRADEMALEKPKPSTQSARDPERFFAKPAEWVGEYELFGLTEAEVTKKFKNLQTKDESKETFDLVGKSAQIIGDFACRRYDLKYSKGKVSGVRKSLHSCNGNIQEDWIDSRDKALIKALVWYSQQMDFENWTLRNKTNAFEQVQALQSLGIAKLERARILRLLGMEDAALHDEIGVKEILVSFEEL